MVSEFAFGEEQHIKLQEMWNANVKAQELREERGAEDRLKVEDEDDEGYVSGTSSSSSGSNIYSSSSDEEVPEVRVCDVCKCVARNLSLRRMLYTYTRT